MLTSEEQALLNEQINREDIQERQGLSYVNTFYVFDTMNRIFGCGGWQYQVEKLVKVDEWVSKNRSGKDQYNVAYIATATVIVGEWVCTDVGYGNGMDKVAYGPCHELATKEAVTDAVKRCCKTLGRKLGLALYDKEQRFVDEWTPDSRALLEAVSSATSEEELAATRLDVAALAKGDKDVYRTVRDAYKARIKELTNGDE